MTKKIYYVNSHQREFDARVLACEEQAGLWEVVLDATCFFPGGGGQACDTGTLDGVPVREARERGEDVIHVCAAPLAPGTEVRGVLDWEARFSRMQLHSGEHVVSGIAHALWGCDNVGFHMAEDLVTLDFNAEPAPAQLEELERRANEAVWADLPVRTWFPAAEELAALPYRSKKELSGAVRLVEIEGIDRCACCAPHVAATGEIGLIRLTDSMRHRGGVRLTMRAGRAAWADAAEAGREAARLSALLSAPRDALAPAAERVLAERDEARLALARLRSESLAARAAALVPTEGNLCFFEPEADAGALRALVNAAVDKCAVCAAFAGRDGDWKYVIGSRRADLRARARELNAALRGRGGGSAEMLQGSAAASRAEIERYFGV